MKETNKKPSPFLRRLGEMLHSALKELEMRDEPTAATDIFRAIEKTLNLSDEERELHKNGVSRWETNVRWYSVDAVKAGYLEKAGGKWSLTESGKRALKQSPDEFILDIRKKYKEWNQEKIEPESIDSAESEESRQSAYELAIERARQEIEQHVCELDPYEFQFAVSDLLSAMGYHVRYVAPPGPDGGVDLVAFQDPLGSDATRLVVQVKHRQQQKATSKEVRELEGSLRKQGDVGLFVSTGGFAAGVEKEYRLSSAKHIDTMNLDRFVDLWQKHYDKLPQSGKRRVPLTRIYFLSPVQEFPDESA